MQVIPAIDLIDGKCVRLTQGDYAQKKIYKDDPAEVAKEFEGAGLRRLHLVDLDGAKAGKVVNLKTLNKIASAVKMEIDFGGGIKSEEDLQNVFSSGAAMAAIGSVAVKSPEKFSGWIEKFGADKFFLGADVKEGMITVSGWLEMTEVSVFDFISENIHRGIKNIFCTDVSKDGMLQGPSTELYKSMLKKFPGINLVASGGVSCLADLHELKNAGLNGAIIGKAIYEGRITLKELSEFNAAQSC